MKGRDAFKIDCMAHTVERLETKMYVAEVKEWCLKQDEEDEREKDGKNLQDLNDFVSIALSNDRNLLNPDGQETREEVKLISIKRFNRVPRLKSIYTGEPL